MVALRRQNIIGEDLDDLAGLLGGLDEAVGEGEDGAVVLDLERAGFAAQLGLALDVVFRFAESELTQQAVLSTFYAGAYAEWADRSAALCAGAVVGHML